MSLDDQIIACMMARRRDSLDDDSVLPSRTKEFDSNGEVKFEVLPGFLILFVKTLWVFQGMWAT